MNLLIRADANGRVGTGHVMRCMSFAQAWKAEGRHVLFATCCDNESLLDRVRAEGFSVKRLGKGDDVSDTIGILEDEDIDWVVLDGYHFGPDHHRAVRDRGRKLLVIDDFAHLDHYHADIVVNQNYGAENFFYECQPYTKVFAGTAYVILRREFLAYRDFDRVVPDIADRLLITMGGGDRDNLTLKILRAVNLVDRPLQVKVVIGSGNPHCESIRREAGKSRHTVEILTAVSDMAPLMAWAHASISAGGTTTWELAFMGLPSLLCIVADNQESSVNCLAGKGICSSLGWICDRSEAEIAGQITDLLSDTDRRARMSQAAGELVDGRGMERIICGMAGNGTFCGDFHTLRRDIVSDGLTFRNFVNLSEEEKEVVRVSRNAGEIRKWMFTDHIISKEEHLRFLDRLKNDARNFYWLVLAGDRPAGVGSFQNVNFRAGTGELGIYAIEKGRGKNIVRQLIYVWFDLWKMNTLRCAVLEGNGRARNLYRENGFEEETTSGFIRREGEERKVIYMSLCRDERNPRPAAERIC